MNQKMKTENRIGITSFQLKIFALLVMTLDHIRAYLPISMGIPEWFHWAGRMAAPLFLFLCAEGFAYTRNRKKYLIRLYIASVVMNLGNSLMNEYFMLENGPIIINGMFITLFLVVFTLLSLEHFYKGLKEKQKKEIWLGAGGLACLLLGMLPLFLLANYTLKYPWALTIFKIYSALVPNLLFAEGGIIWLVLGVGFYLTRKNRFLQAGFYLIICGGLMFLNKDFVTYGWMAAAVIPMLLYHGEAGRYKMKSFFYIYYPAHVYLLFFLGWLLTTHYGF